MRTVPVPVGGTDFIHLGTRVRAPQHVAMPTVRERAVKRPSIWRTVGFFFGALTVSFTLHGLYYL